MSRKGQNLVKISVQLLVPSPARRRREIDEGVGARGSWRYGVGVGVAHTTVPVSPPAIFDYVKVTRCSRTNRSSLGSAVRNGSEGCAWGYSVGFRALDSV